LSDDQEFTLILSLTFGGFFALFLLTVLGRVLQVLYHKRNERGKPKLTPGELEGTVTAGDPNTFVFAHYSRRRRFAGFLSASVYGFAWQMLQLVFTIGACVTYVYVVYEENNGIPTVVLVLDAIFCASFALDFVFNYYASGDRIRHLALSPYPFIDWVTVVPFFVSWALGDPFNTDGDDELFIRSLRLFRALRIIRSYRLLPISKDALIQQAMTVFISFAILVYVSTSIIQFIEDNLDPIPGEDTLAPFDWYAAFYFIIVTFTTVGYGDISPVTYVGRGVMVCFILLGIAMLPYQIGKLVEVISSVDKFEHTAYSPRKQQHHLIVTGSFNANTLASFLEEWYQRCHQDRTQGGNVYVVIVSREQPTKEIKKLIEKRKYSELVTYVEGSPMDRDVLLRRARVDVADAAFIMATEGSSREVDANNRLYYLALKHTNPKLRIMSQISNEDQKKQLNLHNDRDTIFVIGQIQACLAGLACTTPGITTLILNLLTADASETLPDVPEGSWADQYLKGNGEEIYELEIPREVAGSSFAEAAALIYDEFHCILLAIRLRVRRDGSGEEEDMFVLNPGHDYILKEGDLCFVIGEDFEEVQRIHELDDVKQKKASMRSCLTLDFSVLSGDAGDGLLTSRGRRGKEKENEDGEEVEMEMMAAGGGESVYKPSFMRSSTTAGLAFNRMPYDSRKPRAAKDENLDFFGTLQRMMKNNWNDVFVFNHEPRPTEEWFFQDSPPSFYNHVVYIGPTSFIIHYVAQLRRVGSTHPKIVILAEGSKDDPDMLPLEKDVMHMISLFDDVFVLQGSPRNHVDLLRCSIDNAAHVTYMADKTQVYQDEYLADMDKVFMARLVDAKNKELEEAGRLPITSSFEFRYFSNLRFVKRIGKEVDTLPGCMERFVKCYTVKEYLDEVLDKPGEVSLEPLVASGRVWLSEVLLKQLIPLWQTRGSFLHILKLLLHTSEDPLQLITSASIRLISCPEALWGKTFLDAFVSLQGGEKESIIPFGLYRKAVDDYGDEFHFVYTNPSKSTVLVETDRLYVLMGFSGERVLG